jgi:hypothetical protein
MILSSLASPYQMGVAKEEYSSPEPPSGSGVGETRKDRGTSHENLPFSLALAFES